MVGAQQFEYIVRNLAKAIENLNNAICNLTKRIEALEAQVSVAIESPTAKPTSFDRYLEEQMTNPKFAAEYHKAKVDVFDPENPDWDPVKKKWGVE